MKNRLILKAGTPSEKYGNPLGGVWDSLGKVCGVWEETLNLPCDSHWLLVHHVQTDVVAT